MRNAQAHRIYCHLHFIKRAQKRGIDFGATGDMRLAHTIQKLRPAFIKPDQRRYAIRARVNGQRIIVIYDDLLKILLTCYWQKGVSYVPTS